MTLENAEGGGETKKQSFDLLKRISVVVLLLVAACSRPRGEPFRENFDKEPCDSHVKSLAAGFIITSGDVNVVGGEHILLQQPSKLTFLFAQFSTESEGGPTIDDIVLIRTDQP